jgi:carbamate kinase
MAPKVAAACSFVERTGGEASIGSLAELAQVADGRSGTRVVARAAAQSMARR